MYNTQRYCLDMWQLRSGSTLRYMIPMQTAVMVTSGNKSLE